MGRFFTGTSTSFAAAAVLAALGLVLTLGACAAPSGADSASQTSSITESSASEAEAGYQKVTAEEAKTMLEAGDATIVDVRTESEYLEKHIPGAVLVPLDTIGDSSEASPPEQLPDMDAVLLVHCRTGVRSAQASARLAELGYTNVYDFGGIADWPYETTSGEESK